MTTNAPLVLVVDDDATILTMLSRVVRREGYQVLTCPGGREAMQELQQRKVDLLLVDVHMPDVNGLDVIRAVRDLHHPCQIIVMSGEATIDTAVEAIKLGARDFLTKPFDMRRLRDLLVGAREEFGQLGQRFAMEGELAQRSEFCGMIGRGPAMLELFDVIKRLAPHVRSVLVTGETGTGKELVARALHKLGPRRARKFVTINCSAVVESLFESELFGHVRGAFTGATDNKVGLFELANGGTVFLDEVGELLPSVQAKLLRTLEVGEVQRVGSLEVRQVDVRVIAATNRDLAQEVRAGRFRSDLFYRLNIVAIPLPPLRTRPEDIPYLTAAFVREFSTRFKKSLKGVTPAGERLLFGAHWHGNVRELRNVLERACILTTGAFITEREVADSLQQQSLGTAPLPAAVTPSPAAASPLAAGTPRGGEPAADFPIGSLHEVEREHILRVLQQTRGNKAKAARILGLSRRAFYRRLERYDLAEPGSTNESPEAHRAEG